MSWNELYLNPYLRGVRVSGSVPATSNASSSTPSSSGLSREEKEALEKRKKKKTEYLKQRKQELEKDAELASKYRDRAKERRSVQDKDESAVANEKVGTSGMDAFTFTMGPRVHADVSHVTWKQLILIISVFKPITIKFKKKRSPVYLLSCFLSIFRRLEDLQAFCLR